MHGKGPMPIAGYVTEEPKNCGALGPRPFGETTGPKSPLPMCYHVKFGSFASKGVCINRNPKIVERWDPRPFVWGRGKPSKYKPPYPSRQIWWFCIKGCMHK